MLVNKNKLFFTVVVVVMVIGGGVLYRFKNAADSGSPKQDNVKEEQNVLPDTNGVDIVTDSTAGQEVQNNTTDNSQPIAEVGALEVFAKCIAQSGAKFYGASWCPHCVAQKEDFGAAAKSLPYVECAVDNEGQAPACTRAQITAYPTWVFADGSRVTGKQSFEALAQKTGCKFE